MKTVAPFILALFFSSSCASLHQYSIGEMPGVQEGDELADEVFELKVSETGINVGEAASIARIFSKSEAFDRTTRDIERIWNAVTYGPVTGNKVFSDSYVDLVGEQIRNACPNGTISGLASIRETMKYPVISGEIVRVFGYCGKVRPN